ncbi:MAG: MotA/TolQ/ExbB proton channel family protein [Clostridiales Family XIII bacterium]|nr:MotA/TolQ/ExbB proton channel family protein [Clostridiales Family XIII bacterium]
MGVLDGSIIKSGIHTVSTALEIPAIIVLIAVMLITIYQLGSLFVEYFADRAGRRLNVTRVLADLAHSGKTAYLAIIFKSNFQKKQKDAFRRLLESEGLDDEEKRLFATQVVTDEETRLEKRVAVTDVIARIAPMFGLMATLIPLGPGLISLGQGDTRGLADSLLTAFDATVAGLVSAGVAFIISKIRKRWYLADVAAMETILEEVIR